MNLYKVTYWGFLFTEEGLLNAFVVAETKEVVKKEYPTSEHIKLITRDIKILK